MTCFRWFLCAFALAAVSCNTGPDLQDFSILEGTWRLDDDGRDYRESWTLSGDMLVGSATEMADGDTAFAEEMSIFQRGEDGWVLGVRAGDQNGGTTVFFRLYEHSSGYFRFENPSHDFPKRIIYEAIDEDRLRATVDDGPEGDRELGFSFVRVSE